MRASAPIRACAGALVLALAPAAPAAGDPAAVVSTVPVAASATLHPAAAATLEQCVTTGPQAERSATFSGEMRLVPGATRMQMRIEVLVHTPGEVGFRPVSYPGLGAWRNASTGVRIYKNLSRVTNLSGPATYRADISFRWTNARGRTVRTLEALTPRCAEPASKAAAEASAAPAAG